MQNYIILETKQINFANNIISIKIFNQFIKISFFLLQF